LKTCELIYNFDTEKKRHRQAIVSLSEAMGLPLDQISEIYERELIILSRTASIRDFLPILVSRKVRHISKNV